MPCADDPRATDWEVTSFARDAGISEAEAAEHLRDQSRLHLLDDAARLQLGDDYGGIWVDAWGDQRIKLAVVGRDVGEIAPETARQARAAIDETGFAGKVDLVAVEHDLVSLQHEMESLLQSINADAPVTIDAVAHLPTGTIEVDRPKDTELTPAQARFLEGIQTRHGELLRVRVKTGRLRLDVGFPDRHGKP